MHRKLIPDVVKDQTLHHLSPTATVGEAARLMAQHHMGAVLVCAERRLLGIFTERDVTTRVVAAGRDVDATPLSEVMTPDPDTVAPDATVREALDLMNDRGYRHLPIVEDGEVRGIVSIRDLYAAVKRQLEEEVREREAFIHGTGYG